jgi:non-ribosomal peptide synthetase component E (peptide arylation enzyme)
MRLRVLAHSRAGDKGDTASLSLIAHDCRHYEHLRRHVTAAAVRKHFEDLVRGDVVRYELPNLCAFNFVMTRALGGGVTRSLALDAHGKSLSSALLELDIPAPDDLTPPAT